MKTKMPALARMKEVVDHLRPLFLRDSHLRGPNNSELRRRCRQESQSLQCVNLYQQPWSASFLPQRSFTSPHHRLFPRYGVCPRLDAPI